MIECQLENLPAEREQKLRTWLSRPECHDLKLVLASRVKHHQCLALRDAVQSGPYNSKLESANAELRKAQEYEFARRVLQELTEMDTPYTIAKLI